MSDLRSVTGQSGAPPPWHGIGSDLRQLRLPCVPKRQVGIALFHFASFSVCPLAFFPNPVGLVVVAAQIKGRVDNREEDNREYRDADRPHARLPPKIRRRRLKLSEAEARTIGSHASRAHPFPALDRSPP